MPAPSRLQEAAESELVKAHKALMDQATPEQHNIMLYQIGRNIVWDALCVPGSGIFTNNIFRRMKMGFGHTEYKSNAEFRAGWPQYKHCGMKRVAWNTVEFTAPGLRAVVHHETRIIHEETGGMTTAITLRCWDSKTSRDRLSYLVRDYVSVSTYQGDQYMRVHDDWYYIHSWEVDIVEFGACRPLKIKIGGEPAMPLRRKPWDNMTSEEKKIRRMLFQAGRSRPNSIISDDIPVDLRCLNNKTFVEDRPSFLAAFEVLLHMGPTYLFSQRYHVLRLLGYPPVKLERC